MSIIEANLGRPSSANSPTVCLSYKLPQFFDRKRWASTMQHGVAIRTNWAQVFFRI